MATKRNIARGFSGNGLENYRKAAARAAAKLDEENKRREEEKQNASFWQRAGHTVGDILGNIGVGAAKGAEGIYDSVAGAIGAVGGLFNKDFKENVKQHIERDFTSEFLADPLNEATRFSLTNDSEIGRIVESVASGVGQMLPSVIITAATGGLGAPTTVVQGIGLGTTGVSAAGNATEEAFKDGADYYKGLGYGVASGAVEMGTEKLFGGFTKNVTGSGWLDNVGKALGKTGKETADAAAKSLAKEVADTGVKRVVKNALGEGVEEMASELVNPLTRAIYKGKVEDFMTTEHLKSVGEAGLTGALTSVAYGETVGRIPKIGAGAGKRADISESLDSNAEIKKKLTSFQDEGKLTEAAERQAAESTMQNYKNIEKALKSSSEKKRAALIKEFGLDSAFDSDGTLKTDILPSARLSQAVEQTDTLTENVDRSTEETLNRDYYSVDLAGKEDTIRKDLSSMSANNGENIKVYNGALTEKGNANFVKAKKILTALNEQGGGNVSFVVVEPNSNFNGAQVTDESGSRIYISADDFENNSSAATIVHEYTHFEEGTKEYAALSKYLAEDSDAFARAAIDVADNSGYNVSIEDLNAITEKQNNGIELTEDERHKLSVFGTEATAKMAEYTLDNEAFINKLVNRDASLATKIVDKVKSLRAAMARIGDSEATAQYKRLKKTESLYLKAAKAAGNQQLANKIMAVLEKDEELENVDGERDVKSNRAKKISDTADSIARESNRYNDGDGNEVKRTYKYSRKKIPTEDAINRRIAETEKLKIYEKRDAKKIVNTLLSEVMVFDQNGNEFADISAGSRQNVERLLLSKMNEARTAAEMRKSADEVAEYIISRSVIHSWINDINRDEQVNHHSERLTHLRAYLRALDLSNIRDEIRHRYDNDKSVFSRWSKKMGGITADVAAMELNNLGISIEGNTESDLFFAINDAYLKAKAGVQKDYDIYLKETLDPQEHEKLKNEIAKKILSGYKSGGHDSTLAKATKMFKSELWKADQRVEQMKLYNKLISKVDAIRNVAMGRFENANTYKSDLFSGSIEQFKKIVRGGVVSVKLTRDAAKNIREWYCEQNPIVGKENFNQDIADKLSQIADKGLSDYVGHPIDGTELLKPYMHRLDLSGIRDQLKSIYKEENRSILATWNVRKGEQGIPIKEVAAELEKVGLKIEGDDFEMFTQIEQIYRDQVGPLTIDDLRNLIDVVSYFTAYIKNFDKVWKNGRYVDAVPIAEKHIGNMEHNQKLKIGWIHKFLTTRFGKTFMRPSTLAKCMDGYQEGFYTEVVESFRQGLLQANNHEYEMMLGVEEFAAKHKKYFEKLTARRIEFRGRDIPANVAMSLYMTAKRQQAQSGLAFSGFKFEDGKDTITFPGSTDKPTNVNVNIEMERLQKQLYDEFTDEDKEFITIAESIFNEQCKKLKYDTDMREKGYSNTVGGYYYPIKRAFVAKSVDSDFDDLLGRVSNKSFNKDTVTGAKGALCIMPLTDVLRRHVRGVSQYAALSSAIRNYDTLYNLDIGGNANNPRSIARVSEEVWKDGNDYLKKLLQDVQGVNQKESEFLSVLRGSYATYQLGFNPKTWFTQLSSLLASTSVLDLDSVTKGIGVSSKDVDEYCVVAKLRNANNDAILSQANSNKPGLLEKRTKIGDIAKKTGDALMTPIAKVDRFVVKRLFGACQLQIQKNGGAKVGTEENKIEAGKLLEKVIFDTQQNSFATERSAAMRGGDFLKGFTMFSADGMNVIGQVIDAFGELSVLKARLKLVPNSDDNSTLITELKDGIKTSGKKARKALFALISSALFMSALAVAFSRFIYGREPEEDETVLSFWGDFFLSTIGNMMGGLPVVRDAWSYLTDGYEANNYLYSVFNDTLESAANIRDAASNLVSGKGDSRELTRAARSLVYSAGQLTGLPTRNIYNLTRGITKWFSPEAVYRLDDLFYKQSYNRDLNEAIEADDEDAIANIASLITGERIGTLTDDKAREELNRLTLSGKSVLPRAIGDTLTVNDEKYELNNSLKKKFKKIYGISTDALAELVYLPQYNDADDEIKAKAINFIYDVYYALAIEETLDVNIGDTASKNTLFAEAIDIEKLAIIVATARSLTADQDKKGKTISGSRKKKIEKYVESLRLTAAQKYMIMGYLGYTNLNGKDRVNAYINRLKLTKAEKQELLAYSGYE